MRERQTMRKAAADRKICIIAAFDLSIVLIDKIILVPRGAVGAPLALTLVLWFFIYKRKKWAFIGFGILSLLSVLMGALGVFLLAGYLYRGFDPIPSLLMVVVGIGYGVSWLLLRKEKTQFG